MNEIINAIDNKIQELRDMVRGQLVVMNDQNDAENAHLALDELPVLKNRLETIVRLEVKRNELLEMEGDLVEF